MSTIEIKLAEFLIATVALLGLGAWTGYHLTRQHYEVIEAKEQHASDLVLSNARQAIIDLTKQRDDALAKEEKDNVQRIQTDNAQRAATDERVRELTAALRAYAVSAAVGVAPGGPGGAAGPAGAGSVQPGAGGLDESLARFAQATDHLIGACQHDSREVSAIQEVVPK